MILWTIVIILSIVFIVLLFLIWIRKVGYDRIHQNFLDLEDAYGGEIIRHGFAARPRFVGNYKGLEFTINITTEKVAKNRNYYIAVSMKSKTKKRFTIMSAEWLGDQIEQKKDALFVSDKKYVVETSEEQTNKKISVSKIETIIDKMHPFAYILVSSKNMLLEKTSLSIAEDTKLAQMQPLLEGMYQIKTI